MFQTMERHAILFVELVQKASDLPASDGIPQKFLEEWGSIGQFPVDSVILLNILLNIPEIARWSTSND